MEKRDERRWFDGLEEIVADELRFKARLRIGEDVYTSKRWLKNIRDFGEAAGLGGTAVAVANSSAVASTFFAPTGVLSIIGIGTAVTPVGWVVAAGVLSGAGWYGVAHYLRRIQDSGMTRAPDFINSPVDILAVALFDLMMPIALTLAPVDGKVSREERELIRRHFVEEWGFNPQFVSEGLAFAESELPRISAEDLARELANLKRTSKDCNYSKMSEDFVQFLEEVMASDGQISDSELEHIEAVKVMFRKWKWSSASSKGLPIWSRKKPGRVE